MLFSTLFIGLAKTYDILQELCLVFLPVKIIDTRQQRVKKTASKISKSISAQIIGKQQLKSHPSVQNTIRKMQPQRERPLQNSMILPDTNSAINKRPTNMMQYNFPLPNVKKMPNYMSTESHFQHHNVMIQQQGQGQGQQGQGRFPQQMTTLDEIAQQHGRPSTDQVIHEIYDKLQKLGRAVDKHQFQLSSLTIQGEFSKRVMNEVKKNLPVFTGGNDVYEHIFNMKLDLKNLQQQMTKVPKIGDMDMAIKKEVQAFQKKNDGLSTSNSSLSGSAAGKPGEFDPVLNELLRKRDQFFQNMLTNLQTEISIVKKNLSNLNLQMKVSPIVSNSCIILKYQQLFKARNKNQNDMVLSQNNEGFLLDCHSRYIVDQKGKKIKLEERHIGMLRSQKILQ